MTRRTKWLLTAFSAGTLGIIGLLTILFATAVRTHAWALVGLLGLYFIPLGIVVLLVIRPLILFFRLVKYEEDAIEPRFKAWWLPVKERLARDESDPMGRMASGIQWLLMIIRVVIPLPFLALQITIWLRSGAKYGRPRNREATWFSVMIAGAYFASSSGHMIAGCIIAMIVVLGALSGIIEALLVEDGVAAIFTYRKYQVGISFIAKMAFLIAFGFACVHFSISQANAESYNVSLSVLDSLYFSAVTFATVGYGDIYPAKPLAKIACMSEIGSGVLILVVALNVIASVWLQKHVPGPAAEDGKNP